MSDQCPSSVKAGKPAQKPRTTPHELVGTAGAGVRYFRSSDDLADSPAFREHLEREFQDGASTIDESTRRTFLKLMGAGIALAGAATMPGCRQPDHKIYTYSRNVPEEIVPGKPLFYATTMPLPGGGAEGLLIECHEGRPTKVEGNPLHPINQGKSSAWAQASVLDLYDPDRTKQVQRLTDAAAAKPPSQGTKSFDDGYATRTWDDFAAWCKAELPAFDAKDKQGDGLAFIVDRKTSPTLDGVKAKVKARWPKSVWVSYSPTENFAAVEGLRRALGRPMREQLKLERASVILTLDRDFLQFEPASIASARGFAAKRRPMKPGDPMNRIYALEANFSITGASADHRWRLSPQQVSAAFLQIAKIILAKRGTQGAAVKAAVDAIAGVESGLKPTEIQAIAEDLLSDTNLGKSAVLAGPSQPAWVHALAVAVNAALENTSAAGPVGYVPMSSDDEASNGAAALADLSKRLADGGISTVVVLGSNPVYSAPADLNFAAAFAKAKNRIVLSVDVSETLALATWRLNGAHYLEQWGDTIAADGTIGPIQPMIAPLYGGKSDIEVLALMLGEAKPEGYELVREQWKKVIAGDFERAWRRALHDGILKMTVPATPAATVNFGEVAAALSGVKLEAAPTASALHATFCVSVLGDGRFANNAWLNELPDPASKIVWDNAAYISPKTATALGLMQTAPTEKKQTGAMADLTINGKSMQIVCWAMPGVPDNTVVLPLGFGRRTVGLVGQGVGFDVGAVRTSAGLWAASGVTLKPVTSGDTRYHLATTQNHWSMEGRALVREADMPAWNKLGAEIDAKHVDAYGRAQPLNFAERLEGGEFNHMPAAVPIMLHPYEDIDGKNSKRADRPISEYPPAFPKVPAFQSKPQWGMSIDLSSCTGCNVCSIACQAENNIPVVGKIEVNKGREMHWIRIDRYFKAGKGDDYNDPTGMVFQPVACVHCENAPCETVCPVNATVHGPEGHNYMVYNRCIGTRYCANNCPYKVRRFNFFDYGVTKFNGGYLGQDQLEGALPGALAASEKTPHRINPNLIPPRLRDKLDEISKMQKNPNVTVRSRGVMEKCTYCIQRTNDAKIELKIKGIRNNDQGLPDGFVQTACQQACPTNAIVFGDISDTQSVYKQDDGTTRTGSLVHQMREHARSYLLLGFLGIRPRTTYMARINNPNPNIRPIVENPFGSHGSHDSHGHEGGGHDHGPNEAKPHASRTERHFIDPHRAGSEGYVMSLSVLAGSSSAPVAGHGAFGLSSIGGRS